MKKIVNFYNKVWIFMVPGMPGRFRFFLAADLGSGFGWFPVEETLASPETVEELSKSTGIFTKIKLFFFFSLCLSL